MANEVGLLPLISQPACAKTSASSDWYWRAPRLRTSVANQTGWLSPSIKMSNIASRWSSEIDQSLDAATAAGWLAPSPS